MPANRGFSNSVDGLQPPDFASGGAKLPKVSGHMPKYSQFWETAAGDGSILTAWWTRQCKSVPYSSGCAVSAMAGVAPLFGANAIGWREEHGAQQGERPMARELEGKVAVVTLTLHSPRHLKLVATCMHFNFAKGHLNLFATSIE
jgi:hypothetical protein